MMRILLFVAAVFAGAFSFTQWLWRLGRGREFEDREYFAHCYGILAPDMELHWKRLLDHFDLAEFDWEEARKQGYSGRPGSIFHALKNIIVEWVRVNAERAAKGGSFVVVVLLLANIAQAVL